ncbi:MAG TPA: hypothetical protein VM686_11560 [Polyangiaceae bacterium]|nr:hypothetical protein [Polyangiaceae bacterium]
MTDPFRYISYVPAGAVVEHGVEIVLGRRMIPVAAGATPEEAARFADDLNDVMVFDSATGRFVLSAHHPALSPPSSNVH